MDTSENNRNTHIKEELVVVVKKKMCMTNKKYLLFFCVIFTQRTTPAAPVGLWTLSPRFLRGFALS